MVKIEDKVEQIKVSDIYSYKNNAKKHPIEQVRKLADSIKEFGYNVPLIVDEKNTLIAGHGRLLACKHLGMETVPVIRKTDLTDEQIKAYRIMDNKVSESKWNLELLKLELEDLKIADFDWKLSGFDDSEITFDDVIKKPKEDLISQSKEDISRQEKRPRITITFADVDELEQYLTKIKELLKETKCNLSIGQ